MFRNYSYAIVDVSKNNPYPPATEFLKSVQASTGLDATRIVVLARNNQKAELQAALAAVRQVKWVDDLALYQIGLVVPVAKQELTSILQIAPQDAILMTSYNGAVLGEIQRLGYPNVDPQSLGKYRPGFGQLPPRAMAPPQLLVDATAYAQLPLPAAKPHWRFDGFIARDEAQSLLLRALHRRGAVDRRHTLPMPNLKPAIAEIDCRFVGLGSANGTAGMIGALAAGAHHDGWIEAAASYNGTPYYWLTARALQHVTVSAAAEAKTAMVEPPPPPAAAAPVTIAASAGPVSVSVERAEDASSTARRGREPSPHKSQRMQDTLIESGWGPRTKPRLAMLSRIDDILGERQGTTLTEILDSARDDMIQAIPDGPEKQKTKAAISVVRKMLREFLPASKALKDANGNPLPLGFRAGPTAVADFDADWRKRTEAQLLLKLIAVFREPVSAEHDIENFVGALYHVRSGPERRELKRQVEAMIGYLLDEGLVHEELVQGHKVLVIGPPRTVEQPAESTQLRIAQGG